MERNDAFFFYLREPENHSLEKEECQQHPSTFWGGFQLFNYQATGLPKYPPESLKDSTSNQQEEEPKFHPNIS